MTEQSQPGTDVAARPATGKVPVSLVGQVTDLDQAYRYADALSKSNLLPKDLTGKTANVLVIMLYGQQIGLTPMQAVQSIYVVNGRPSMSGQLWLSKVREAGHAAYIPCTVCWQAPAAMVHKGADQDHRYEPDHDEQRCSFTIARHDTGEEHTETFTWEQAVKAKLTGKDVWKSWPKRMLLWRAVSNCATVICPEVALGFGADDPEPDAAGPGRRSLGQVAAERTDRGGATADDTPSSPPADPGPSTAWVQVEDAVITEPEPERELTQEEIDEQRRLDLLDIEREHTAGEDRP